jgi:hypothetical protein
MPLTIPDLDFDEYKRLLEEALERTRVHSPEWINFDESDPGITPLQLFAFLEENLLSKRSRRILSLGIVLGIAAFVAYCIKLQRCNRGKPSTG